MHYNCINRINLHFFLLFSTRNARNQAKFFVLHCNKVENNNAEKFSQSDKLQVSLYCCLWENIFDKSIIKLRFGIIFKWEINL